jgi:hypothetical protein
MWPRYSASKYEQHPTEKAKKNSITKNISIADLTLKNYYLALV